MLGESVWSLVLTGGLQRLIVVGMARRPYDLVLRWPRGAGDIKKLNRMVTFPVGKRPRHIDPDDGDVWVAVGSELVARFRTRGISGPRKVKLLTGTEVAGGYRLQLEPNSVKLLSRPISMADIQDGASGPFGHPEGMRYLQRRPRRFVTRGDPDDAPLRQPRVRPLEVRTAEEWLAQTKSAARETESVKHPTEGRLVAAYAAWRRQQTGKEVLIRYELRTSADAVLLTDAFDTSKNLLLEAKATTERPAIRMAIGQLLDYSLWAPKSARMAVLVPRMPSDDLIKVAARVNIDVVWQTPNGDFTDTEGGKLST